VPGTGETGGQIRVESIERAMFLDASYAPEPYFIADHAVTGVTLTQADPQAVVWTAAA
jgi:hypothetical protein